MLEIICAIPEHIGWIIVGCLIALNWFLGWKIGKVTYIAIKERLEDKE